MKKHTKSLTQQKEILKSMKKKGKIKVQYTAFVDIRDEVSLASSIQRACKEAEGNYDYLDDGDEIKIYEIKEIGVMKVVAPKTQFKTEMY